MINYIPCCQNKYYCTYLQKKKKTAHVRNNEILMFFIRPIYELKDFKICRKVPHEDLLY